jgi:hypothetical protein
VSELSVSYERKFSDGNYGSEGLSVSWSWDAADSEGPGEAIESVALMLRTTVLTQLANSAAERVRWAANHELHARDPKPADGEAVIGEEETTDLESLPF